jgi:hypothetical protein
MSDGAVGLRDWAVLSTLAYTIQRAGAVTKLRLQDSQEDGTQSCCGSRKRAVGAGEIPVHP